MKFHGITMVGPFVNQKLSVIPVFDPTRDQGRLVWLTDGTLWYGSDTEWVNFSSGAGDANEVEDMYSDLLRTTIFMNASYDEFADEDMVLSTNMAFSQKYKFYEYTTGQQTESVNLYDVASNASYVDYVLPSVDYTDTSQPLIEVSSNGGVDWFQVQNNKIFRIPPANAGVDLRMRFTGGGTGTLKSWGVLYNKDLSAGCTKWGLTYKSITATSGQTSFDVDYQVGAIQVFLNGRLLDDSDFTATTGTEVVLDSPTLDGDIIYVTSYSTSILNPNVDFDSFIKRDGTVNFLANQSMDGNKIVDMAEGTNPTDAVTFSQLQDSGGDLATDIVANTTAIGINTADIVDNTTTIGINTADIGNNATAIGNNTADITDLQDVVSTPQEIVGGDITKSGNNLTVEPCKCVDSTYNISLETTSNVVISIPTTLTDNIYYIYIVRLVSTGLNSIKAYPNDTDVLVDTLIDAYRFIDFWNTDGSGNCVGGRTIDGVKYFDHTGSLVVVSTFTATTWSLLNLSSVVPIEYISKWLPGASWVGTTTLPSDSTSLELSINGSTINSSLYNYNQISSMNRFWGGGVDSPYNYNVELPPTGVSARMVEQSSPSDNFWGVSFQKIYLRR